MLGKKKYRVSVMDRSTRVAGERDKWRGLVIGPNLQQEGQNERKSEQAHIPHAPTLLENAV